MTPNSSWPDVVYYQSYTHPYMGWRINVVDNFNKRFVQRIHSASASSTLDLSRLGLLLAACCASFAWSRRA